ncbi:hypothetical protein LX77_00994 [Gelidibacter algens]|uniref:Uncharacterized protein n=2 Tax=Gelidibacter algens TaxID=49280 RepID=A0A1A7R4Q6_9FLAO|nr:hypothetical protein A9996_03885 [Gelidibacter algens]RAJ26739.1 hypothetical protein LX77_00994 [Gelidibacter algens]
MTLRPENLKLGKTELMKTILTSILLLFSTTIFAQIPDAMNSSSLKTEADRITDEYDQHLGLTGIQYPLFKNKVADYLRLAEKIKDENEGRAELDALVEMQARESLAMNDILTRLQYRLYKKLKSEIQPLKIVKN